MFTLPYTDSNVHTPRTLLLVPFHDMPGIVTNAEEYDRRLPVDILTIRNKWSVLRKRRDEYNESAMELNQYLLPAPPQRVIERFVFGWARSTVRLTFYVHGGIAVYPWNSFARLQDRSLLAENDVTFTKELGNRWFGAWIMSPSQYCKITLVPPPPLPYTADNSDNDNDGGDAGPSPPFLESVWKTARCTIHDCLFRHHTVVSIVDIVMAYADLRPFIDDPSTHWNINTYTAAAGIRP
jgi:hypothetical protein